MVELTGVKDLLIGNGEKKTGPHIPSLGFVDTQGNQVDESVDRSAPAYKEGFHTLARAGIIETVQSMQGHFVRPYSELEILPHGSGYALRVHFDPEPAPTPSAGVTFLTKNEGSSYVWKSRGVRIVRKHNGTIEYQYMVGGSRGRGTPSGEDPGWKALDVNGDTPMRVAITKARDKSRHYFDDRNGRSVTGLSGTTDHRATLKRVQFRNRNLVEIVV